MVTVDGQERDVAISQRRNRWRVAGQILAGMPWQTIEALDRRRAIVGILQREDGADAPEEEADEGDGTSLTIRETQLVELVIKAQKTALDANREGIKPVLDTMTRLLSALSDRVMVIEEALQDRLRRAIAAASQAEDGEGKEDGLMSTGMIEMLLKLAMQNQSVPKVAAPKPKPPNGAKVVDKAPAAAKDANPPPAKEG